ncbi:MAG: Ppx/GppA family phosphatase [Oligoflexia bacterium]|nr:Ppx/GppA family phosphatase [Oligoflexia bacterium]
MIRASIDLGTNTCLLLVAEAPSESSKELRVVSDHSTIVRLGQEVDRRRELHPDAIARTLKCLQGYAEVVRAAGGRPEEALCVATSQARDARNGAEFFARVEKETGFRFRVISGDEEARLTFLGGLLPGMDPRSSAVIDIGGGSTEFIGAHGGQSVDVGSVRFTERHLKSDPVTDEEFWACQQAIDEKLEPLRTWRKAAGAPLELVAVAGTATTLAAWQLGLAAFDARKIDEVVLTRGDVHRLVEELKWRTVAERRALTGIEAGRADVLLAGAMVLWRAMEVLDFPFCRVSSRGLRFGALLGFNQ